MRQLLRCQELFRRFIYTGILGVSIITAAIFLGYGRQDAGDHKKKSENRDPVSCVEQILYGDGRKNISIQGVPKDLYELTRASEGGRKQEKKSDRKQRCMEPSDSGGWYQVMTEGTTGIRFYVTESCYVTGWQFIEREGEKDWYYFEEEGGLMLQNALIDGAYVNENGYAVAAPVGREETIWYAQESSHCEELLLIDSVPVTKTLVIRKDMTFVTLSGETCEISPGREMMTAIFETDDAQLCLGSGIVVASEDQVPAGICLKGNSELSLFGTIQGGAHADAGIVAVSPETRICLYEEGCVREYKVGILSVGDTDILGGVVAENGVEQEGNEKKRNSQRAVSKKNGHGIMQLKGTLRISGGTIYDNGTLGSEREAGSLGGGVYLGSGASMNMSGGVIAANRASAGGGIYADTGSRIWITGGRIGGKGSYYDISGKNTAVNGNYARESRVPSNRNKYRHGSGGGIYSLGTVTIQGKKNVQISDNCTKGASGGGGINVAGGKLYLSGTVEVSRNRAGSSAAKDKKDLYRGGDQDAEGGGIRIGQETKGFHGVCYINCRSERDEDRLSGDVRITGNEASGDGGGIFLSSDKKNILCIKGGAKISKNCSRASGGGGVKSLGGGLILEDVVLTENQAYQSRGGGVLSAGKTRITDCEITKNRAKKAGAGISFYKSTAGTIGKGIIEKTRVSENKGDGIACEKSSIVTIKSGFFNKNERDNIRNEGYLYVEGGQVQQAGRYGLYCKTGCRTFFGKQAQIDAGNAVFLEQNCKIEIYRKLTYKKGLIAVLNTKASGDRMPGRVLVTVSYPGGKGADILWDESGTFRFQLEYIKTDTGAHACVRDGRNLSHVSGISASDIYLSERYQISYHSGYENINGAQKEDVRVLQKDQIKYWMEDVWLDLRRPLLYDQELSHVGWKFLYWKGDSGKVYQDASRGYTENKDLSLTAVWELDMSSDLTAWLYNWTAWLRNEMQGEKTDEQYKQFIRGDTGSICFRGRFLTRVKIWWPDSGSDSELRIYDRGQKYVKDQVFLYEWQTGKKIEDSSYRFRIPPEVPDGNYRVEIFGWTIKGDVLNCPLTVVVQDGTITKLFRTRIRS